MSVHPLLWPSAGALLVAGMAMVLNRLDVARVLSLWSAVFGAGAALASIANLVALAISPQRFFGNAISPESIVAMRALAAPGWLNIAVLAGICATASMAVRAAAVRRLA